MISDDISWFCKDVIDRIERKKIPFKYKLTVMFEEGDWDRLLHGILSVLEEYVSQGRVESFEDVTDLVSAAREELQDYLCYVHRRLYSNDFSIWIYEHDKYYTDMIITDTDFCVGLFSRVSEDRYPALSSKFGVDIEEFLSSRKSD